MLNRSMVGLALVLVLLSVGAVPSLGAPPKDTKHPRSGKNAAATARPAKAKAPLPGNNTAAVNRKIVQATGTLDRIHKLVERIDARRARAAAAGKRHHPAARRQGGKRLPGKHGGAHRPTPAKPKS